MDNIAYKYNKDLILFITVAPLLSYLFDVMIGISLNFILVLMSFIGVLFILVFKDPRIPIRVPTYLIFYFLFTLYRFYSALILLGNDFEIKFIYANNFIAGINMIFIIENIFISKKYYDYLFRICKFILIISFFVIIYQELFDINFLRFQYHEVDQFLSLTSGEYRLKSIYGYTGYLSFGLCYLPILLWVIESLDKRKKKILIWVLMGFIYIFISKARWLMVNSITIFIILIINGKNRIEKSLKYGIYLIFLFFIGFYTLNFLGIDTREIVEKRILESDKGNINQTSAGTRLFAFEVFDKIFWDEPVLGAGNRKYGMVGTGQHSYKLRSLLGQRTAQIHVGYLSLFYKFGLVGGFLYMGFLVSLMKTLFKTGREKKTWAPFLAVLGFALVNFTQVSFTIFESGFIIVLLVHRYLNQDEGSSIKKIEYA